MGLITFSLRHLQVVLLEDSYPEELFREHFSNGKSNVTFLLGSFQKLRRCSLYVSISCLIVSSEPGTTECATGYAIIVLYLANEKRKIDNFGNSPQGMF